VLTVIKDNGNAVYKFGAGITDLVIFLRLQVKGTFGNEVS
jgi:hypothetical protein